MNQPGNRAHHPANTLPGDTSPLRLRTEHLPAATVLTATGDIDLLSTDMLSTALAEAIRQEPPLLIVDLTSTSFLSGAGILVLLAAQALTGDATRLLVVASSRATWRPLHLTGADQLLSVHGTLHDVLPEPHRQRKGSDSPGDATRSAVSTRGERGAPRGA
ncbi:STAS domain-containing protein [Amycolatopsis mongoliensis]|uniref:STAS domain-containing protein n=1 Tax=Amycolatopsis mongoliensis TaxID=715475 RepID=UPI002FCD2FC6